MSSRFQEFVSSLFPLRNAAPDLKHELGLFKNDATFSQMLEDQTGLSKSELVLKLISTVLGISVTFGVTYFGIKWLTNALDPTSHDKKQAQDRAKKLMTTIGVPTVTLTAYEMCIASNLIDTTSLGVTWDNIGGLNDVVQEIKETVILPFKRIELFSDSSLIQGPKGVLLYGPPGCGKTLLAKAMAKSAGARFINLQISSLVDKWYGESQKRAEAVFSLARKIQPTIIFIDEIDSFLRSRTSVDHEATVMMKTQFMSFWDGLLTDSDSRVMIVGATNRPADVDAAILRRMPCMFHVDLPNTNQRYQILKIILEKEKLDQSVNLLDIANKTTGLSGSDLKELCRMAAIYRIRDFLKDEEETENGLFKEAEEEPVPILRPIEQRDFLDALKKSLKTRRLTNFAKMQQMQEIPVD